MSFLVRIRRGSDLLPLGDLDEYTTATVIPRFNKVGAFTVTVPAATAARDLLLPGNGLIIWRGGYKVMSGPIQTPDWSGSASDGGEGTLQISGVDDMVLLAQATVWPTPANDLAHQTDSTFKVSGAAETVLYHLVDTQIGPSARTERKIVGLTLGTDLGRGVTVVRQINQFVNLLAVMTDIAKVAGLGFRIIQTGGVLRFEVYQPQDLSVTAKFSFGLGNLTDASYTTTPPTCTCAIVVAGGVSSTRTIVEYLRADPLDATLRIEQFVDLTSVNTTAVDLAAQMSYAGAEALTTGARQSTLSITPIDIPAVAYGRTYNVGDKATVELDGITYSDTVQQVTLTSDPSAGDVIKPLIGSTDSTDPTQPAAQFIKLLAAHDKRLRAVETRVQQ